MLVTRNAADLCTLLVNELYGQLPSRITAALLARGRSNVRDLSLHTSLNPKQVRHGLALVIQHNLVFYQTDRETAVTTYEANPQAAYHLVRVGKTLDVIGRNYGVTARNLVNDILILGNVEITELVRYHRLKHGRKKATVNGNDARGHDPVSDHEFENGNVDDPFHDDSHHVNGNGVTHGAADNENPIQADEIYDTLAQLIAAGVIETVSSTMFQSPQDLKASIEQECAQEFPNGVRGAKVISEFDAMVKSQIKAIGAERSMTKRKLQESAMYEPSNIKRRKLANGGMSNGFAGDSGGSILRDEPNTVVRLNFDKCLVELRNQKLTEHAEDFVGEITAQVYAALLASLCKKVYRCQHDQHTIMTEEEEETYFTGVRVTTEEVFDHLSPEVDVATGIGTASEEDIDIRFAEKIRKYPPQAQGAHLQGDLDAGDEIIGSDDEDYDPTGERPKTQVNGNGGWTAHNGTKSGGDYSGEGPSSRVEQIYQMRQHLLILAEAKQQFVRHCGHNEWTVDFGPLIQQLRYVELDTMIEDNFGRQGLRLTRILREKGKLDDKTLPAMALMRKPDVHVKMAEMEMAGFLEVQEVPRDNNRAANRTMFFWFFDEARTLRRVLDNGYKSMVRCLERLEVERYNKRHVVSLTERKDVQGNEEQMLRGDVYNEYLELVDMEKKLFSQVSRLDDLVSIFQDF
ncbi:RNA polymerase III subunit RPC82 [Xylaria bambusicola]|uniref:RNA polymerase III subunit RPC82 n=1 Tax=Xylaria bambusicola TaxID=326684 RepID=UPI0020081571|nr:RNA polymerase III subunit RPC82 [Xylaria bambusicola]KAI0518476.1 RNA polymerase III subunit RPC82 [Xylaria bambusicola]